MKSSVAFISLWIAFSLQAYGQSATEGGWKSVSPGLRISRMILEPIIYEAGPDIAANVHAYITYEVMPGDAIEFLNARLTDPVTGNSLWLVQNIPLLPFNEPQIISYAINVEAFGSGYEFLQCAYNISSTGQANGDFPADGSVDLTPQPAAYLISSGSDDPSIPLERIISISVPPALPKVFDFLFRGCDVPNVDLDNSKKNPNVPNDNNACGPAAAANSLHWLVRQHDELAGETSSLRAKVDSLKKYMNMCKEDTNGVRFDSMVVGKLTLIDKLKLPISVKYKTKHESGNVEEPLASTGEPKHTATNHGKLGVYPDFDWMKKEMENGEDVEIHVGWYGPGVDGALTRRGGHWVVATGYFSSGMTKGVFIKDDDDQSKEGGLRHKYYEWAPGDVPYLLGLTDANGNVAIVESVVSESYDPAMEDDYGPQYIHPNPLEDMYLTGERMKPFYPAGVTVERGFPWIPVIGGATGAGIVTYLIISNDKSGDCAFTIATQISHTVCELSNGAVSVMVSPADDYQYQWSNGATTNSLQNISAGNYSVTVTKAGTDCQRIASVTVMNSNPAFNTSFITENADCGEANGSAVANVNPAGFYSIAWSNGGTGEIQNDLAPGNYTVTVSAGGTCVENYNVTIEELPPSFELTVSTTPSECGQATGESSITVLPAGNYTYEWSNGNTDPNVTGLAAGEYHITVTLEGTQCSKTVTAEVGELPPDFEITISTTSSECGQATGTGTISVTTPGEYTYAWPDGSTGQQVTDLAAGSYTITVTLAGTQCSKTISAEVGELPPSFDPHAFMTPSMCEQPTGTGAIFVNPPGDYTYTWSNGSTGQQVMDLPAGIYSITVTLSGTDCSVIITAEVLEHLPTFDATVATTPSGCTDSTGTATITVDPVGEYTYAWSNGLMGSEVTGLPAGDYAVTITLAGTSCSKIIAVNVGQAGVEFTATLTTDSASCGFADGAAIVNIDPPGEYTYLWSNQQTGNAAQQLMSGNYTVTVTDANGCSASFTLTVGEMLPEYISIDNTSPGTCIGEGQINFTLTTPGTGPLVVEVTGPEGTVTLMFNPGSTGLGNLPSGDYSLVVFDQLIGQSCTEVVAVTIQDNTPAIVTADDFYSTPAGEPVSDNVLLNDSGLNIEMTSISDLSAGTVTFDADGDFVFTPDPGFTGEASFVYTVTDVCGNSATAMVFITVEGMPCDFSIEVTTIPASCGLDDGAISVEVNEPGSYIYIWSTGDSGPVVSNLPAGMYTVTITEISQGCSLEFIIELTQGPADYISNIVITQPTCSEPAEISFTAFTPGDGQLVMTIDHPNGSGSFFIPEGQVFVSDFVPLTAGAYTIEVTNEAAGPDCFENFMATINAVPFIEIAEEAVFPPSTPTAMDGSAIIVITVPGESPYTIFLNGMFYGVTTETVFTIEGLGAGEYTVQVRDEAGCLSNELTILVPLPDIVFSFGSSVTNFEIQTVPEMAETHTVWTNCLVASAEYFIGKTTHEIELRYAAGFGNGRNDRMPNSVISAEYLMGVGRWEWFETDLSVQGGVGFEYFAPKDLFNSDLQHWLLRASARRKIGDYISAEGSAAVGGWKVIKVPVIDISIRILFPGN